MKYISLISTDFHLKQENLENIRALHKEAIEIAEQKNITNHIWLGDIFDSRISQKQDILNVLTSIIEDYDSVGHKIICISGNHDKTNYNSKESFLDSYKYHPSFDLIDDIDYRMINGIECFFLPFFSDDILKEKKILKCFNGKKKVLFGHFAVTGSRNNDGSVVESDIKVSDFKCFDKVFLGHYHDYQEISKNIIHLGSLQQNNFGEEENNKGFWLLDDKLNVTNIPSKFGQRFKKLEIDLKNTPIKQVDTLIQKFKTSNPNSKLRVEVWGEESSLKAFEKDKYVKLGIDVKKKSCEVEIISNEIENVKILSSKDIQEKFKLFCKENDYNYQEGEKILKEILYENR